MLASWPIFSHVVNVSLTIADHVVFLSSLLLDSSAGMPVYPMQPTQHSSRYLPGYHYPTQNYHPHTSVHQRPPNMMNHYDHSSAAYGNSQHRYHHNHSAPYHHPQSAAYNIHEQFNYYPHPQRPLPMSRPPMNSNNDIPVRNQSREHRQMNSNMQR